MRHERVQSTYIMYQGVRIKLARADSWNSWLRFTSYVSNCELFPLAPTRLRTAGALLEEELSTLTITISHLFLITSSGAVKHVPKSYSRRRQIATRSAIMCIIIIISHMLLAIYHYIVRHS